MRSRNGFTLIEMVVAIVVATMVVLTGRGIVEAVGDAAHRAGVAAADEDAVRGADLMARLLLAQARALTEDSVSFFGTPKGLVARSWCPTPGGWSEECQFAFAVVDSSHAIVLQMGPDGLPIELRQGRESASLIYLKSADAGGTWLSSWQRTSSLPIAVGIVVDGDTVIMPVGRP